MFVNAVEVVRVSVDNVTSGILAGGGVGPTWVPYSLTPTYFSNGANVLAVEFQQVPGTLVDFDLRLSCACAAVRHTDWLHQAVKLPSCTRHQVACQPSTWFPMLLVHISVYDLQRFVFWLPCAAAAAVCVWELAFLTRGPLDPTPSLVCARPALLVSTVPCRD